MKVRDMIEKLKVHDWDLEVVLFFNSGDDMFYEEAGDVKAAYIDEDMPWCYTSLEAIKKNYDDDEELPEVKKVVAILA